MATRVPSATSTPVYRGVAGSTRKTSVHYTCSCGTLVAAEVYRSIDVSAQPELRQRMLGNDPERALNVVACPEDGTQHLIAVPVVYHDPEHRLFVLVLPEHARHQELTERAALLAELAADAAPVPAYVRDFAVVFGASGLGELLRQRAEDGVRVAREAAEARKLAEDHADLGRREAEVSRREVEVSRREAEISRREVEVSRREAELGRMGEEAGRLAAELAERQRELAEQRAELDHRRRELDERASTLRNFESGLARRERALRERAAGPHADERPARHDRHDSDRHDSDRHDSDRTQVASMEHIARMHRRATELNPFTLFDDEVSDPGEATATLGEDGEEPSVPLEPQDTDEEAIVEEVIASSPHPYREGSSANKRPDIALESWKGSGASVLKTVSDTGAVRIAVSGRRDELEALLGQELEVRVQLHCFPSYPLVDLALGPAASWSGNGHSIDGSSGDFTGSSAGNSGKGGIRPLTICFNIADEHDRAVLSALEQHFALLLELFDDSYAAIGSCSVAAELSDNIHYVLVAAEGHLASIQPRERSYAKALVAFGDPAYDAYGWSHPERRELREDKLDDVSTAQAVRRALAIAERFSSPKREEYLFLVRGYSRARWERQRRKVLARAVELGIWVGRRLAPIAVAAGLARSERELVELTRKSFAVLLAGSEANDLDADAISDNWTVLTAEAERARQEEASEPGGVSLGGGAHGRKARATPIESATEPMVSGTIGGASAGSTEVRREPRNLSSEELLAALAQEELYADAAVELARRRELRAIAPIMGSVTQMSRADAVRVLGAMASFGDEATSALIDGLRNHKSYVRQGCALALAIIKNELAVEALSDLLVEEPTALWKEVARGMGMIGPSAIMSLATRLSKASDSERVAWALAHIAVRGGKKQVKQLASGRDVKVAGVARQALELASTARADDLQVRGGHTSSREHTIHRAFSRRFFESLEAGAVVDAAATVDPEGTTSAMMLLDEADLLEAAEEDPGEMLDESDLIPT